MWYVIYTRNNFSAGVRYESYLNALQGFDKRYVGSGIPYRYASYNIDNLEVMKKEACYMIMLWMVFD